jgi:hypothetical protein
MQVRPIESDVEQQVVVEVFKFGDRPASEPIAHDVADEDPPVTSSGAERLRHNLS